MSRFKPHPKQRNAPDATGNNRPWAWIVAGIATAAALGALFYALWVGQPAEMSAPGPPGAASGPAEPSVSNPPAESAPEQPRETGPEPAVPLGFEALRGRWLREDGGYVLEVRGIEAGGRMDAAYLNPGPVRVSRAEASREGTKLKVFVELRDTGYPGCTYTLEYNPGSDALLGVYYQAAVDQSFEVMFVRAPR
jgi:hypothetical protein